MHRTAAGGIDNTDISQPFLCASILSCDFTDLFRVYFPMPLNRVTLRLSLATRIHWT